MTEESKESVPKSHKIITTVITVVAITMGVYQLAITQTLLQGPIAHRITHLGFALVLVFLTLLLKKERNQIVKWGLLIASPVMIGYFIYSWQEIMEFRSLVPLLSDVAFGIVGILLVFVATYMVWGKALPIIAAFFIAYVVLGRYLPFPFTVAPVPFDQLISWLSFPGVDEGIFGDILTISANFLFLFVFFGAVLYALGGMRFILGISQLAGAKLKSGPAAVAVMSSALVGTVTGSTSANITITGAFTIPSMKRSGYRPEQAGAIEAAASNGGQIMPPIMGATAFVMAGFTGIPYIQIVGAAVVPALLYFFGLLLYAELTARQMKINVTMEQVETKQLLLDAPIFFVPLGVLVFLLIEGFSLPFVGFWAIVSLIVVALISSVRKEARLNRKEVVEKIVSGVQTASEIAVMCALVGVLATCIKVSGLGIKLPLLIQDISRGYLIIALLLGMVSSIILGMGVTTIAAYLLVAIGLSPALIEMGVPLLAAHLFPFIFAVFSHLTPPVAVGALIASRIAGASYWETAKEALKSAFTAFLLPFFIIYAPIIILRPDGNLLMSTAQLAAIIIGITSLQIAISNYFYRALIMSQRVLFTLGALSCLAFVFMRSYPLIAAGTVMFSLAIIWHLIKRKQEGHEIE